MAAARQTLTIPADGDLHVATSGVAGSTLIPTMTGARTAAALTSDDAVFDGRGRAVRIRRVHAAEEVDGLEIALSTGEEIVVASGQRWTTETLRDRAHSHEGQPIVSKTAHARVWKPSAHALARTTREIADTLAVEALHNHTIALAPPLVLPDAEIEGTPYALGARLGRAALDARVGSSRVPLAIRRGSARQRARLLAGVLDTQPHSLGPDGMTIATVDKTLAGDLRELVASLGYRSTLERRSVRGTRTPVWAVAFLTADDVYGTGETREAHRRWKRATTAPVPTHRYIVAARPIGRTSVVRFEVDGPSDTVLLGRTFVPALL
ncbi:hypothetical protein [Microbacterium sp. NPDC055683]